MPGYGQNTKIPVTRANRTSIPAPTARSVNPTGRPPTGTGTRPATTSSGTPRSRTYTKSKPIGGTPPAPGIHPPGETNHAATTGTPKPETSSLHLPSTAPPSHGSYGQRYNALKQASTPTPGYARPLNPTENSRKKPATATGAANPSTPKQPVNPLISDMGNVQLHLPLRPMTSSHPRSKKLCKRPLMTNAEDENANSNSRMDVPKAGTVEFSSMSKSKKTRSVSRKGNKRSTTSVTRSNGNSNQSSNDSTVHTTQALENVDSLNIEGKGNKPKSGMLQLHEMPKASMLSEGSKIMVEGPDSSMLQLSLKAESDAAFKDLPNLNVYDLNLSAGYGHSIHIDSNPALTSQSPLSLDKLPEYTLKQPKLSSSSQKHVENFDGLRIEDMTPPAELHQVVSDPKLHQTESSSQPESITEMRQPDLVASASEESLHEEATGTNVSSSNSNANSSTVSASGGLEQDDVAQGPKGTFTPPQDTSAGPSSALSDNVREHIRERASAAYGLSSFQPPAPHLITKKEEYLVEEFFVEEPPILVPLDLNCYEVNPLEKYEYLGNVVNIPRQITLTKDIPPLYVGTFPIENTSEEDLIFKVKTKTQTANVYAINPKLGTLNKNSSVEVKIQADFSKGMPPSLDMTTNNMVVLLATAPTSKMTRKDLEQFWKLLQDQQDDGKSSFYIHSIENIQLTDIAGNSLLKEKKSAAAVAKKPLLAIQDDPKLSSSVPEVIPDVRVEPQAAPSNIVNANDVVISNEPSAVSTATDPSFEEVFTTEISNSVTDDIRSMTGNMNFILRWGSIAIYVSSVAGLMFLLYQNMKDVAEFAAIPDQNQNKGLLNVFSSSNKKER